MPFQGNNKKAVELFIASNQHAELHEVALKLSKLPDLPKEYILNQVNGRKKSKRKFPFLLRYSDYVFPSPTSFAQASSERMAQFKSTLFEGKRLLDLTGGMGIDTHFFAKRFDDVDYVEQDSALYLRAKDNFHTLGAKNIHCYHADANSFIKNAKRSYDAIYIDPDRRLTKSKGIKIEDCTPNVIQLLPQLWNVSSIVLVKLSPLLDLSDGLSKLPFTTDAYIVSDKNEVKELLFLMKKGHSDEPTIHAVDVSDKTNFSFKPSEEKSSSINYHEPMSYLYEGNAALMKAGAFKLLAKRFGLKKIAPTTHLYTSDQPIGSFPGRCLAIEAVSAPKKQKIESASIVCRNYPERPDQLRKKYKIKEDANRFLYACRLADNSLSWISGRLI